MTGVSGDEWNEGQLLDVVQSAAPIGYGIVQPGPYVRDGVPVLAIRDLAKPSIRTAHRSSPAIEAAYRRSRITAGDVLISVKGTTGRVGIVPVGFEGNISRDVARVRLTHDHDPEFWCQLLRSFAAQQTLQLAAVGSTRQELSIGTLKRLRFRFPSRPEQERISKILSDFDQLIAALECLIVKKQAIKRGLMQQLLPGKTRLPGFTNPWCEVTLGELATIVSGGTPKSSIPAYWDGGIPWCTPTDITGEPGRFMTRTERTISQEGLERSAAQLLPAGSLLLCTRATIGEVKIATVPIATNQGFKSLVPRPGVSGEFLYYKMLSLKEVLVAKGTGSTFLEVSKRDVASLKFQVPGCEEQAAIAAALFDTDDEIDLLKHRLAKARSTKQGMMQQLLTGRTRLPVKESAA